MDARRKAFGCVVVVLELPPPTTPRARLSGWAPGPTWEWPSPPNESLWDRPREEDEDDDEGWWVLVVVEVLLRLAEGW